MQRLNTEEVEALVAKAGSDPLTVAVNGINLSLAHHAAWTEERFEKIAERFDRLDHVLDRIDATAGLSTLRLDSLETGQRKLEEGQAKVVERLDLLTAHTLDHRAAIGELQQGQADLKEGLGRLEKRHDRLEQRQDRLEVGQAKVVERLDLLTAHSSDHRAAIGELQQGQAELKEGQARLEAGHGALKEGLGRLEVSHGVLKEGQARLEAGHGVLKEGLGRLDERCDGLEALIGREFAGLGARLDRVLSFADRDGSQGSQG